MGLMESIISAGRPLIELTEKYWMYLLIVPFIPIAWVLMHYVFKIV